MRLLAIDPSLTCTGLSVFENDKLIAYRVIKPKTEGDKRYFEIAAVIFDVIKTHNIEVLAIETQYFMKNVQVVMKLSKLRGIIEGVFATYCWTQGKQPDEYIYDVYPAEAKSAVGAQKFGQKRKESKENVGKHVAIIFPELKDAPEDVMDAVAIGIAGYIKIKNKLLELKARQ